MARERQYDKDQEFKEKVVDIRRVCKVVKGGKKMGFRAVVIVGDKKTKVGMGIGKAAEVSSAIRKAVEAAKRALIEVPLIYGTIPHDVEGNYSACKVVMRPAAKGTGVIAGGSVRTVLEMSGLKNIVAKLIGSTNAINAARAAINGLLALKRADEFLIERGKEVRIRYAEAE